MATLNACNDIFDSLAWDPDLAYLPPSPDKSPEPVTIKPQPIAYTTVGSVVNPRAAPQFSAPNRIQREGAQRKSLMSILQTYEANSMHGQARCPLPPLNMANSMHYAQQLGRNPPQTINGLQQITNRSSRPSLASLADINNISDEDLRILIYSLGQRLNLDSDVKLSSKVKGMAEEELAARCGSSTGPIQGLEKMQTVQRLSKFPNPMQKVAQSKLSEFSVTRLQQLANRTIAVPDIGRLNITDKKAISVPITNKPISHSNMPQSGALLGDVAVAEVMHSIESSGGLAAYLAPSSIGLPDHDLSMLDGRLRSQGELDHTFRFPVSGSVSNIQANPLYGAYGSRQSSSSIPTRSSGYPQPLTAGPPGQRQNPVVTSFTPSYAGTEEFWPSEFTTGIHNPFHNDMPYNHTNVRLGNNLSTSVPSLTERVSQPVRDDSAPKHVIDTLSLQDAYKYYPNGFPVDMTGYWAPLSEEKLRKLSELAPLTAEEKANENLEALNQRFYHGYRRMASMGWEDYEAEYRAKQVSPYGPIGLPPKAELQKRSMEEWNNMTEIEEAITLRPFLNAAYGTLLDYLNKMPGSRCSLSQWREADDKLLDHSKDGNKSYFGEDWGAPPRNSSANVNHQPSFQGFRAPKDVPNPQSASQILAAKHMQQR